MVQESVPVEINGERYSLRFEDGDVMAIEQQFRPVAMMFHPQTFGFDTARIFLWRGLRKTAPDGTLTYALSQDIAGYDAALQMVKKFTGQFPGPVVGLSILYGSVNKALIVSGWYQETPVKTEENGESKTPGADPSKNLQTPTTKPMKRSLTGFVSSLRQRLGV